MVTVTNTVRVSSSARVPRLQGRAVQAPVTDTSDKPGGVGSVSDTAVADIGPGIQHSDR